MPDGRKRSAPFETDDDELAKLHGEVIEAGGRFTVEMLSTGHVSIACEGVVDVDGEPEEMDVAIELVQNTPEAVPVGAAAVIRQAWDTLVKGKTVAGA